MAASVAAVIGLGIAAFWAWPTQISPRIAAPTPAAVLKSPPPVVGTEAKSPPRLSIVVLPFSNLSSDPNQDYLADAITDDLTTDLSRISGSFVIARNSAFSYKGKSIDVRQIGRELGVRYILEGSVRRTADQFQVNVQLVDAESGAHVWADRFATDPRNLVSAENQITARLARNLQLEIVQAAARVMEQEGASDPGRQDLILRARAIAMRPYSRAQRVEALQAWETASLRTRDRSTRGSASRASWPGKSVTGSAARPLKI